MPKHPAQRSWSGSAGRAAAARDGVLFAVAGVVPAILAVALGLRAVRNEEAAVRREASSEVQGAARRAEARLSAQIREGEERLAALDQAQLAAPPSALRPTVLPLAPPWAEVALLDARLEPISAGLDASSAPEISVRRDPQCRRALRAADGKGEPLARRLAGCDNARSEVGAWLVPLTLLGILREVPDHEAAEALIDWLGKYGARMTRAERAATEEEIRASRMTGDEKARATSAMARGGDSSAVASALRSTTAREALARGGDARGLVRWKSEGAIGVFRVAREGGAAGFVVDAGAIGRALATKAADAQGSRLAVVAAPPDETDAPRAVAWLAPGLGIEATLRDGGDLEARTRRSRWGLWAIALGSASVALVFAVVLFRRLRAARRTSELRTTFAAAVSHELRTPIASIRMLAELLEGDRAGDEEERRDTASAIARESRRLGETVSRLLAWSRMSAGQTEVSRGVVTLADVVGDAIDVFEERNAGTVVERDLDPALALALDAPLVQLAVMNLLENAKKYAPQGQPYRVRAARIEGGARIEVVDRGPGVPRAWRARIFEAFERGDDRLSRATEGTGIGLALVRAVARAHGGDATLGEAEHGGAVFVVELRDDRPSHQANERHET